MVRRRIALLLAFAGVATLGTALVDSVIARVGQQQAERRFAALKKSPIRKVQNRPPFPWRIKVERLLLDVTVEENAGSDALRTGGGHVPATAYPGEAGNIAIAAHRDTYFRPLRGIRVGDRVELGTADRTFTFIVSSIRIVNPKDTWVLASGRESMLTLLTCYPFGYVGPAPQRMVVQATLMPDSPDLPNENQYQGAVAVEEDANCM